MAITGISALSGQQIIASGACSARSAATASYTTGGNDIQGLYTTVNSNSGNWSTPLFPDNITADSLYIENDGDVTLLQKTGDDSDDFAQMTIRGSGIEFINGQTDPTIVGTIAGNDVSNWNSTMDTVSSNSAAWAVGGVDSATVSAIASDYAESAASGKLDTTAFNSSDFYTTANPSGFITGVDLAPYQTTAGMTAYQPAGDYLTTGDSAEFYSTANPSGFITGVPVGTMNESEFDYDALDNITGYNGSAFKAGDEFPQSATEAIEVVTSNSADWNGTTDAVSSNSGAWGGDALPISAGPGVKVELTDGKLLFSTDETVLWETTTGASACTLSEPMTNFKSIKILYGNGVNAGASKDQYGGYLEADSNFTDFNFIRGKGAANVWWSWIRVVATDRSNITIPASKAFNFGAQTATTWQTPSVGVDSVEDRNCLYKVIGVNRTAGGN